MLLSFGHPSWFLQKMCKSGEFYCILTVIFIVSTTHTQTTDVVLLCEAIAYISAYFLSRISRYAVVFLSRDAAIWLQAWEQLPAVSQRVLSPSLIHPSIALSVSLSLSLSLLADNGEHGNVKDILLAFLWAWSGYVSLHMSLAFFVYSFWQAFYGDGFLLSVFENCVYKPNLTDVWRVYFWACHPP